MRPARWAIGILAAIMLVGAVVVAFVPALVARDQLAERIEAQIAATTGHEVSFDRDIDIAFLPVPTVTIHDLELTAHDEPESEPLMVAETLAAKLELLSVFTGQARFGDFELTRPAVLVDIRSDGGTNWTSRRGHIAESAEIAAENARNRRMEAENRPPPKPLPATPVGLVAIRDGTLTIVDHAHGRRETLSAINGQFSWPRIGTGARLDMAAVFRGEPIKVVASAERPADLLAGNVAPFWLDFSSQLLNASYNGSGGWMAGLVLDGELDLSSPSARRALRWSGTDVKPGEAIGVLELEADLKVGTGQVLLSDLILNIDDNRGIGALDISWPTGAHPKVAGTLAYNTANIGAFLRAFAPLNLETSATLPDIDTSFLRQLGLDLRLSVQTARLGPLTLTNLAASARIAQGRAIFDIGDATAYGGSVLGRVAISEHGFDGGGELQLSAQNIDFGKVYDALGTQGPLPRGVGSVNLSLSTQNPVWATTLRDVTGKIEVSMGQGTLPNINLARFRELSEEQRFFPLSRAANGEFAFERARLDASFATGTAEIGNGEIIGADAAIVLSGIVPYYRGSLAMSGLIADPPPEARIGLGANSALQDALGPDPSSEKDEPLRFFIGGSWPEPVISPIVTDW